MFLPIRTSADLRRQPSRTLAWLGGVAALLGVATAGARAQPEIDGRGSDGLPALESVGLARTGEAGSFALSSDLGYGYTEGVLDEGESHHRGALRLGAGVSPLDGLALGVELQGRVHRQAGGEDDGEDGVVVHTRLAARVAQPLTTRLQGAAELRLQLGAADSFGDALSASSVEFSVLPTYRAADRLVLSGRLGFRLDRAARAIAHPDRLAPADRIALDTADNSAIALGLGAEHRWDSLALLSEWTWQPRVGSGAQSALQSPMWLSAGIRVSLSRALHWRSVLSVSPSARPELDDGGLHVVEPRFWIRSGLSLELSPPEPRRAEPAPPSTTAQPESPASAQAVAPPAKLQGRVLRPDGVPVVGAQVQLQADDTSLEATTDDQGHFEFSAVPAGPYSLNISAPGYRPYTQQVDLASGQPAELGLALERALPDGQLRGQVKAWNGRGVLGHVRIDPLGLELDTDAEGRFEVDVPPGSYTVVVDAPGYRSQQRQSEVEENGVTVLLIELRKEGRKR